MCQVSLGLKEVQMGAHDFKLYNVVQELKEVHVVSNVLKLNKVPLFAKKQ